MRKGVMAYDEARVENAQSTCPMCFSETDADGLSISAGGADLTEAPGHCESCGAERAGNDAGALVPHACCLETIGFLSRFAADDPLACMVALYSLHAPGASCRHIAEKIGVPKTNVNAAQVRAAQYCEPVAAILGRQTAAAIAQRARRALERIESEMNVDQMELLRI